MLPADQGTLSAQISKLRRCGTTTKLIDEMELMEADGGDSDSEYEGAH